MKSKKLYILIFAFIALYNWYIIDGNDLFSIKLNNVEDIIYERFLQVSAEIELPQATDGKELQFSYHVYHGEEPVKFDNVRVPLSRQPDGVATAIINVDLNDGIFDDYDKLDIGFDLLDTQELIWLSQTSNFNETKIEFRNLNKTNVFEYLKIQFERYTTEMVVNIFVSILFFIGIMVCFNKERNNF